MSTDRRLPIRPAPLVGEALDSYVDRVAEANSLRATKVLGTGTLEEISATTGVPVPALSEMTLDRYPACVTGTGSLHSGGWRVNGSRWICPSCTPTDGRRFRDWDLFAHPICTHCRTYLVDERRPSPPEPAPAEDLEAVQQLMALIEATRTSPSARRRLRRLRRLLVLAGTRSGAGTFGARLNAAPTSAAELITSTIAADTSELVREAFVRGSLAELKAGPGTRLQRHGPRRKHLQVDVPVSPAPRSRERHLRKLINTLAETGLHPRHVPACPPDHPVSETPADACLVLHALLQRAHSRQAATEADHASAFALEHLAWSDDVRGAVGGWAIHADLIDEINGLAERLHDDGLIDYQRRRDTLVAVTLSDHHLRRLTTAHGSSIADANTWAWIHLTHGPTGPGVVNIPLHSDIKVHVLELAAESIDHTNLTATAVAIAGASVEEVGA